MNTSPRKVGIALRIVLPILILGLAAMAFAKMKSMKRKPATKERLEPVRQVSILELKPADETIYLSGYALVGSQTRIPVSPEVRGTVVSVMDSLENGALVKKGDVVLNVDDRDVRNTVAAQEAEAQRLNVELQQLTAEKRFLDETLVLKKRNNTLNKNELKRLTDLRKSNESVSQSAVEAAEQRVVASSESVLALEQQLTMLPLREKSIKASLKQVNAQLKQHALTLERCSITAPISGRLTGVAVERGQMVQPGQTLFLVVDDDDLAAQVDLPAADVLKWLPITMDKESGWLTFANPITADITWVDDPTGTPVTGVLDRVEGVDGTTRSARLIFIIRQPNPRRVYEGMFCRVAVKGRQLQNVFRIPRRAISVDGRVPTMTGDGHLLSKTATLLTHQGEDAILAQGSDAKGLQPGDNVITSPVRALPEGHRIEPVTE